MSCSGGFWDKLKKNDGVYIYIKLIVELIQSKLTYRSLHFQKKKKKTEREKEGQCQ